MMEVVSRKLRLRVGEPASPRELMADWRQGGPAHLPDEPGSRYTGFQEIVDLAENALTAHYEGLKDLRNPTPEKDPASSWHLSLYDIFIRPSAETISGVLQQLGQTRIVFAFDECTQLGAAPRTGGIPILTAVNQITLIALQRMIKAGDKHHLGDVTIWYILLDTNSSIIDLAPQSLLAPSFRLGLNHTTLPPWLYLGFDQMRRMQQPVLTPNDALHISHLQFYGRPVSSYH